MSPPRKGRARLAAPALVALDAKGHVAVLGAGVVGTATAWYLLKEGYRVSVIERQPGPALETSWGNGGVIHASEVEPWSQPGMPEKIWRWLGKEDAPILVRYGALPYIWRWGLEFRRNCTVQRFRENTVANLALALHSLRCLQEIGAETGIAYDRAANGVLKIYRSEAALDAATKGSEELARHGLLFERVDGPRCVALEPALAETGPTLVGGLYFPRDEVGDCNLFTTGLAAECQKRGARYHFGRAVTGLDVTGGAVRGVWMGRDRLDCDQVVVALGSFSAPLLEKAGLRVPIYPVKGISITFPRGAWETAPRMPVIDDSKIFGLVPIGERMRISGSAEVAAYDATPSALRGAAIVRNACYTFPELDRHYSKENARLWGGLRPVTPSGRPIVGPTPVRGLWINAGHGHLGWTLACGSGRALADLVAGRDPGVPVTSGFGAGARAA
jgi:D-amino-acid dehydrogenase